MLGPLAMRQRIRAPLRFAVPPSRTSQQGTRRSLGGNRQPPRRGEVERRGVAPQLADHSGQAGASYALLHRPQRSSSVPRLDVDELDAAKPWRIDPPAFEDRHAVLHPEQGLAALDLRQQETRPACIARAGGEQLRTKWGWAAPAGTSAHPAGARPVGAPDAGEWAGPERAETASAGDEGQAFRHTTHNVSVLLLFFIS